MTPGQLDPVLPHCRFLPCCLAGQGRHDTAGVSGSNTGMVAVG
jgi:hypothetical protein